MIFDLDQSRRAAVVLPYGMTNTSIMPIHCRACGSAAETVRTTPGYGALPMLSTFKCTECGDTQTLEVNCSPPRGLWLSQVTRQAVAAR